MDNFKGDSSKKNLLCNKWNVTNQWGRLFHPTNKTENTNELQRKARSSEKKKYSEWAYKKYSILLVTQQMQNKTTVIYVL